MGGKVTFTTASYTGEFGTDADGNLFINTSGSTQGITFNDSAVEFTGSKRIYEDVNTGQKFIKFFSEGKEIIQSASKVGVSLVAVGATANQMTMGTDVSGSFTSTGSFGRVETAGNLNVVGTLITDNLETTHFTSSFVTSSTITTEGNTIFGDTATDSHTFNGHITASGNISASGDVKAGTFTAVGNINANGNIVGDDGTNITNIANISLDTITADANGNTQIGVGNTSIGFDVDGETRLTVGTTKITVGDTVTEGLFVDSHITASGDISSSGTILASGFKKNGSDEFVDISSNTNLAGGTGITLTGDTLSTTDGEIVHDNLSGFVANEHIDHSGVTMTAGAGLNGGGTIAATRTFSVDSASMGGFYSGSMNSFTTTGNISSSITSTGSFGNIIIGNTIHRAGDSNTRILFTDDDINITVGGMNMVDFTEAGSDEITFNEGAADLDVRIEGEDDPNLLFTDASTPGRVGIGTKNPTKKLQVEGDISASGAINTLSHITASGDISASGTLSVGSFTLSNLNTGNVTASGNISGSGTLDITGNVNFDGDLDVDGTTNLDNIDVDGTSNFADDITLAEGKSIIFDSTDTFIKSNTENPEDLEIAADEDIFLSPDDNLLIQHGTTTYATFDGDARMLTLNGALSLSQSSAGGIGTKFEAPTTALHTARFDSDRFRFWAGGGERLTILSSSGYVGLGVAAPDHQLHLVGTNPQICIEEDNTEFLRLGVGESEDDAIIGYHDDNYLRFGVYANRTDTSIDTHMTIGPTGHITASGNISASGGVSVFGQVVHLEGTDPRLKLKARGANHPGIEWHEDSTRKWVLYNDPDESDKLVFKNDSTELVKINQAGATEFSSHITASGDISSSGTITAATLDAEAVSDGLAAVIVAEIDNDEIPIAKLAEDAVTVTAGTNLSGGGSITLGGSATLNVDDAFLKNDADDTTSGTITAGGFTTTKTGSFGEINLDDDKRIKIGTGDDLQIYHNGSNSVISDVGAGDLLINGANVRIRDANDGNTIALFTQGAGVEMRHDNTVRFETTTTGVKVSGNISSSSHITASGNISASGTLSIGSTLYAPNIGTGVDNSVVILDSDGLLQTDEIDSRVWGSTLLDDTDAAGYVLQSVTASLLVRNSQTGSFVVNSQTGSFLTSIPDGTYSSSLQTFTNITASGNISCSGEMIVNGKINLRSGTAGNQAINFGESDQQIQGGSNYLIVDGDDQVIVKSDTKINIDSPVMGVGAFTTGDTAGAVLHISGVNATNETLIVEGSDGTDYLTVGLGGHITASGTIKAAAGDFGDGNITNVGTIDVDTIRADAANNVNIGLSAGGIQFNAEANDSFAFNTDFANTDLAYYDANEDSIFTIDQSVPGIGIGALGGAPAESLDVEGNAQVNGNVIVAGDVIHKGDTDTKIAFTTDTITMTAGNIEMLKLVEGVGNAVTINEGAADVNVRIESENDANMVFIDGANDKMGIRAGSAPPSTLTVGGEISASGGLIGGAVGNQTTGSYDFPGAIMGYNIQGLNVAHASYNLTNSYAVPDAGMHVVFVAPKSGIVEIEVSFTLDMGFSSGTALSLGLSDSATYNQLQTYYEQIAADPDENDDIPIVHKWVIPSLTAGTTYKYWMGAKVTSTTGTPKIVWGGNASGRYRDFIMKATALPSNTQIET